MNEMENSTNPARSTKPTSLEISAQAVNNPNNSLDLSKLQQEVHQLKDSFAQVYVGVDRLSYEYSLMQEAKRIGMSVDHYRRLFELRDEEFLPPYPKPTHWWNSFTAWEEWLKSLPEDKKRSLIISLTRKSVVKLVEGGTLLTLLVAGIHYLWTIKSRQEQSHNQAWQIINSATTQTISGGRIEALQNLAKDGVSLNQLTAPKADLRKISLEKADIERANLEGTILQEANLYKADFTGSILNGADLYKADLREVKMGPFLSHPQDKLYMNPTYLKNATLSGANLEGANLDRVDLEGAWLNEAQDGQIIKPTNLKRVYLKNANLKGAHFHGADLEGAWFARKPDDDNTDPARADLEGADFRGAKNLTAEQVQAANNWNKAYYDEPLRTQLGLR